MTQTNADETRTIVREHYGQVASRGGCAPGCCGTNPAGYAATLGYSAEEQAAAPEGADLGLGCGNPTAIAALRPGETVLDLGSGAGFDSFLAARQVGPSGQVIGVDMTPEMIAKARANARKVEAKNVDFRLGEIERLPVADASVDAILSNCVINLSPDKPAVFREAFRVLRPGGRLAISDVVATGEIPPEVREQAIALAACIAGATPVDEVRAMLGAAGFEQIEVRLVQHSSEIVGSWMPGVERFLASATIEARRPAPGAEKKADGAATCCAPECCA